MLLRNISFIVKQTIVNVNHNVPTRKILLQPKLNNFPTKLLFSTSVDLNTESNIDLEKKHKILMLEIDVLRQEGRKAPDPELLKTPHWDHIHSLASRSARKKYYSFLWKNEKKKENDDIKKQKRKEDYEESKKTIVKSDHITYGLMDTGFLLRIYDSTINQFHNNKLIQAMQFGQKLIFDCSYDKYMNAREAVNAAKQLMFCFAENRMHNNPFDLHFCNANRNGLTMKYLQQHIPTLDEKWFPLNVHEQSYLDLYPKERFVYLTPHCRNDLESFNCDDIYIIGAMVDKINNEPLSLAKAKKLGLRMARLPLDRYLQWGSGSGKSLALNQMTQILLELKDSNNWNEALKYVPRRKIVNETMTDRKFRPDLNKYKFNKNEWNVVMEPITNDLDDETTKVIKKNWNLDELKKINKIDLDFDQRQFQNKKFRTDKSGDLNKTNKSSSNYHFTSKRQWK